MSAVTLEAADKQRIAEAVGAAEAGTSGEIYVVIARSADEFRFVPVLWAALIALALPWPLHLLTSWSTTMILLLQALAFVLVSALGWHPAMRRRLVPARLAAEASRKAAEALFMAHGVHLTEARTGVLVYVALEDRRVEIVADAGIHGKVDQAAWDELAREVVAAARAGRLADGIVAAVRRAGEILARHFPRAAGDRNELPDRVVEV